MLKMYSDNHLTVEKCEMTKMPLRFEDWLELTKTAEPVKSNIIERMKADINGVEKIPFIKTTKHK